MKGKRYQGLALKNFYSSCRLLFPRQRNHLKYTLIS